jgi:hypothetical protein
VMPRPAMSTRPPRRATPRTPIRRLVLRRNACWHQMPDDESDSRTCRIDWASVGWSTSNRTSAISNEFTRPAWSPPDPSTCLWTARCSRTSSSRSSSFARSMASEISFKRRRVCCSMARHATWTSSNRPRKSCGSVFGRRHLQNVLTEYTRHYNGRRPHPGCNLRSPRPDQPIPALPAQRITRRPVLGGLINEYQPAARTPSSGPSTGFGAPQERDR